MPAVLAHFGWVSSTVSGVSPPEQTIVLHEAGPASHDQAGAAPPMATRATASDARKVVIRFLRAFIGIPFVFRSPDAICWSKETRRRLRPGNAPVTPQDPPAGQANRT